MNDHVDELLALHALGGLEPEEATRVENHLAHCPACRAEADAQQSWVSLIAQSTQPVEPPGLARARVLRRIQKPSTPAARLARARWPAGWPRLASMARQWAWPILAGAAIVGLVFWNLRLQEDIQFLQSQLDTQFETHQEILNDFRQQALTLYQQQAEVQNATVGVITSPNSQEIALTGTAAASQASGRVFVGQDHQTVVIVVKDLPPLKPGQTYQVWVMTEAGPQPSLVFAVNSNGWGTATVPVPAEQLDFSGFGISVEPEGGSQTPTEVVMIGNL